MIRCDLHILNKMNQLSNLNDEYRQSSEWIESGSLDPYVTREEYLETLNSNNSRDRLFGTFHTVTDFEGGYVLESDYRKVVVFNNGDGSYWQNKKGNIRKHYFNIQGGGNHLSSNMGINSRITLEDFAMLACCILEDCYPFSFAGLVANMIDGTGNRIKCSRLGLTPNYRRDNIEMTTKILNLIHSKEAGRTVNR
jgi:hypothetical protein